TKPTYPFTKVGPASAKEVRQLLRQPAGLDKPLENIPLRDALELLSDRFHVTIRIDPAACARFAIEQPFQLYDQQVQLPVVRGLTVGEVLHDLLAQVKPAVTFTVKGTQIAIVPVYMIPFPRTLYRVGDEYQPMLNPDVLEEQVQGEPVTVDF